MVGGVGWVPLYALPLPRPAPVSVHPLDPLACHFFSQAKALAHLQSWRDGSILFRGPAAGKTFACRVSLRWDQRGGAVCAVVRAAEACKARFTAKLSAAGEHSQVSTHPLFIPVEAPNKGAGGCRGGAGGGTSIDTRLSKPPTKEMTCG